MNLLDKDLLKTNCADDESMMLEMIGLGLQSLGDSLSGINTSLEGGDWDGLARILHKLRPVLCYCGITSLTDELLLIEENAKQRNDLPALEKQMNNMIATLEKAQSEMEQEMALLSK